MTKNPLKGLRFVVEYPQGNIGLGNQATVARYLIQSIPQLEGLHVGINTYIPKPSPTWECARGLKDPLCYEQQCVYCSHLNDKK